MRLQEMLTLIKLLGICRNLMRPSRRARTLPTGWYRANAGGRCSRVSRPWRGRWRSARRATAGARESFRNADAKRSPRLRHGTGAVGACAASRPGTPPLGWMAGPRVVDEFGRSGVRLVPHPVEHPALKDAVDMVLAGKSLAQIARYWSDQYGITAAAGVHGHPAGQWQERSPSSQSW